MDYFHLHGFFEDMPAKVPEYHQRLPFTNMPINHGRLSLEPFDGIKSLRIESARTEHPENIRALSVPAV